MHLFNFTVYLLLSLKLFSCTDSLNNQSEWSLTDRLLFDMLNWLKSHDSDQTTGNGVEQTAKTRPTDAQQQFDIVSLVFMGLIAKFMLLYCKNRLPLE